MKTRPTQALTVLPSRMHELSLARIPIAAAAAERIHDLTHAAKSANTRLAYDSRWRLFKRWCQRRGLTAMPADVNTIGLYFDAMVQAGKSVSTIEAHRNAISVAHKLDKQRNPDGLNPVSDPRVRELIKGIRRTLGTAQKRAKPVLASELKELAATLAPRDRALLLLLFSGAFRGSEVVSLLVEDLSFEKDGLKVLLRKSKTDQEAEGFTKGIVFGHGPACPVAAMKAWIGDRTDGFVFPGRDDGHLGCQALYEIVKRKLGPEYSSHSFRAGFVTSAFLAGKGVDSIQAQTGHRSLEMLLRYRRSLNVFTGNAGEGLL